MNTAARRTPQIIRQAEPRWRMTALALIGLTDHGRIAYGRWDRQFGAWIERKGEWLPFSPVEPFLDHRGVWLEPNGKRTDAWYEERAMKAAYFSLIPTFVRRLASSHGCKQWPWFQTYWNMHSINHSSKEKRN
ncbi:MAG: hypothetical protein HQL43_12130 [Alphaproteobacteria bacterium]|nr:hypothetical protein [Alphaproteobacteria bacterium]